MNFRSGSGFELEREPSSPAAAMESLGKSSNFYEKEKYKQIRRLVPPNLSVSGGPMVKKQGEDGGEAW
ncbi:uncharacterized protein G2W53_028721 [Senna tora]|uniref:Uncharacterized protein n=1 Tax=Senna tora TaxID=362788 RepID=A0A834T400_9FABA|nr:uncharacterized protein G2W53_028721 [Senna tora]